jgi:hypothetical protein
MDTKPENWTIPFLKRRIREILGRLASGHQAARISTPDSPNNELTGDPVLGQLLSAASALIDTSDSFLAAVSAREITKADFFCSSTDLLAIYDEFLAMVKGALEAAGQVSEEDENRKLREKDLVKLFVAFDYDRQLLAGAFALLQQQLSDTRPTGTNGPATTHHKDVVRG